MSSSLSSITRDTLQDHKIYCRCNQQCLVYTCQRGENRGRKFYRCPRNRSQDNCGYLKWVDETYQTINVTKYQLVAYEEKLTRKLESITFQVRIVIAILIINVALLLVLLKAKSCT
ncbi:hypothetical protein KFK09_015876 [Dendrobium nobile]|uniref:GRF-type domain-containing protein n=1 Tax=Dendrobium nobile TaxID=94219 RepID=A0A8T3B839_DENNO|nr:hypothetical protein KFK09_015876 [Dendrobium nobile]